jgi:hypothetical protein
MTTTSKTDTMSGEYFATYHSAECSDVDLEGFSGVATLGEIVAKCERFEYRARLYDVDGIVPRGDVSATGKWELR